VQDARFTADGQWLLLEVAEPDGLHLWTVRSEGGVPERVSTPPLVPTGGAPCDWGSIDRLVLCRVVAATPGPALLPKLSQLTLISLDAGRGMAIGPAGRYDAIDLSPGGQYLVVGRADTATLEVWDATGAVVRRLGRRAGTAMHSRWDPNHPARLAWLGTSEESGRGEALWVAEAPFRVAPIPVMETDGRLEMLSWSGDGSLIVTERKPQAPPRLVTWAFEDGTGKPREIWHR
jgi:WD40 repeat protein